MSDSKIPSGKNAIIYHDNKLYFCQSKNGGRNVCNNCVSQKWGYCGNIAKWIRYICDPYDCPTANGVSFQAKVICEE